MGLRSSRALVLSVLLGVILGSVFPIHVFVAAYGGGSPPPPSPPPPQTYWYASGEYSGANFGAGGNNTVYDPYVYSGHVNEHFAAGYDSLNWMEVGWAKQTYAPAGRWFFVGRMINGVYYENLFESANLGTHDFRVQNHFLSGLPSRIWKAIINGNIKLYETLTFEQAWSAVAQSESYNSNQNQFSGHFWNLMRGGAIGSSFVWYYFSNTLFWANPPYYVIPISDVEFYTEGP